MTDYIDVNFGTSDYGPGGIGPGVLNPTLPRRSSVRKPIYSGAPCAGETITYIKNGKQYTRRKTCFRRKRSKPESGCLLFKKHIRDLLVTKARGAAPVKGVRSHMKTRNSNNPGEVVQRRTDVRIGKGVIDAIHDLVLTHCDSRFASAVLDATVEAWASTFNATNSRKVHGRSTIRMAHYEAGERSAHRLVHRGAAAAG